MSIRFLPGSARLTVLGIGWSNSSIESGDGLTEDGKLWEDIAGDLGYDYGSDTDWDNLASENDWSDSLKTDESGNTLIPEDVLFDLAAALGKTAQNDANLMQYSIDPSALKNLWGGPVSKEKEYDETDPARPHRYSPPVFYIQIDSTNACLFQSEPFYHSTAEGGDIVVSNKSISIRGGSSMAVYWSSCASHFGNNYLPSAYQDYPIEYICWQCLHGSFSKVLVSAKGNIITTEQIKAGELYEKVDTDGKTYYKLKS